MRPSGMPPARVLSVSAIILAIVASTAADKDLLKCSACDAVGAELAKRLAAEQPRNALDVRHRLDKDGKRYGKVISFQVSELRVVELLDGVCNAMDKYQLAPGGQRWVRSVADPGAPPPSVHQLAEERRLLKNSCADILERSEEELTAALREGRVSGATLPGFLCNELQGCPEAAPGGAEAAHPEEEPALVASDEL